MVLENKRPTIQGQGKAFVTCADRYQENPLPVHKRWAHVLQACPYVRDNPVIWGDFEEGVRAAYTSGTYDEVLGASELVLLKWRFYSNMYHNHIGMRHIAHYEVNSAWAWMLKLTDRLHTLGVNKSRSPREPKIKTKHLWLN